MQAVLVRTHVDQLRARCATPAAEVKRERSVVSGDFQDSASTLLERARSLGGGENGLRALLPATVDLLCILVHGVLWGDESSLKHQAPKQDAVLVFNLLFEASSAFEVTDVCERGEGFGCRAEFQTAEFLGADT